MDLLDYEEEHQMRRMYSILYYDIYYMHLCVPIDLLSNLSYGNSQQTLQNRPLPTTIPTYETIPPLSNFMDGIKLDLVEPKEEGCDVGNNGETYRKLNRASER